MFSSINFDFDHHPMLTPFSIPLCPFSVIINFSDLFLFFQPDHPDHEQVSEALEAMKNVAVLINERKRRMESLEKLALWQQRVEGWDVSNFRHYFHLHFLFITLLSFLFTLFYKFLLF